MQKVKKLISILTILNIILAFITVYFYLRTEKIEKIIKENIKKNEYIYSVHKDTIKLKMPDGKLVKIGKQTESIKVESIYKYDTDEERVYIVMFIKYYNKLTNGNLKRSVLSMIGECRLHTFLYELGYKKAQSADVDIDNEKDKRWCVNVLSSLMY